jgi:hypothetical protein
MCNFLLKNGDESLILEYQTLNLEKNKRNCVTAPLIIQRLEINFGVIATHSQS